MVIVLYQFKYVDMTISALYFILQVSVGMVCLWAGLSKVYHLPIFVEGVARYRLIPRRFPLCQDRIGHSRL